jgi:DHA2 family multidrug resistance protein
LQMLLDRGEQLDWFSSGEIIVETVVSACALYLFIIHILTAKKPFIALSLFKDRNFATGLIFIFILGLMLLATMALITPFVQNLMGYPVVTAGLVLSPRGLGTMAAMMAVGQLISRVDPRWLISIGLCFTAWSLWVMSDYTYDVSMSSLIWTGVIQGLGLGFIFVPLSTISFSTLQPELRTQGTALFSLIRNVGSSIGISVVIFLLARNTQINHSEISEHITAYNSNLQWPKVKQAWNLSNAHGRDIVNTEVTKQASTIAYADDFWLMTLVSLAALPLVLILQRPQRKAAAPAASAAMD